MKIFENIMNSFKRIFIPQKKLSSGIVEEDATIKNENTFMDSLKKESEEYLNKKSILDEINRNPSLIDTLPYSRLVQLNSLYEERINEIEKIISKNT